MPTYTYVQIYNDDNTVDRCLSVSVLPSLALFIALIFFFN